MRRLALSVVTACGLALLTACGSSGGYGFSSSSGSNTVDSISFSNGSAQTNDFFVTPGGTKPLEIDALGQKGTGPAALVVPDAVFTWAGRFVNTATDSASVASYGVGPTGTTKPCPKYTGPTPAVPILIQNTASTSVQGYPTYSVLPAGQASATVFVGSIYNAGVSIPPPYCLVIQATHVGDGRIGSVTALVTNGTP